MRGTNRFDVIYGTVASGNSSATAGVQKTTAFDQYFCNGSGSPATGGQSYILTPCGTPTPTPTASAKHFSYCYCDGYPTATPRQHRRRLTRLQQRQQEHLSATPTGTPASCSLVCRSGHAYGAGQGGWGLFPH